VTATGNRDNKEIRSMSGPMSERAPDITVEADGHADSTTVLVSEGYAIAAEPTQPNQRFRMPTFATKSLFIGAKWTKGRSQFPFCPRLLLELSW
jgi:hypothetical protein